MNQLAKIEDHESHKRYAPEVLSATSVEVLGHAVDDVVEYGPTNLRPHTPQIMDMIEKLEAAIGVVR